MIEVRRNAERGHANHGWLDSHHTFSFAGYRDPRHMGFRSLRVINEDRVAPGGGFGAHPHRDMEIVSYVIDGALEHRDSIGNGSIIRPGDVQRMSAGTGITHSEFNHSVDASVHFLQIWFLPSQRGLDPGYEQKTFDADRVDGLQLVGSPDGRRDSVTIHQDVLMYRALPEAGGRIEYTMSPERHAWLQVVGGSLVVNGQHLEVSDAAAFSQERKLVVDATSDAHFLIFDMA